MRGSPHLHALIWTSDCPKLTQETKQDYIEYVDQHVQAYLPDKDKDPDLHESVKNIKHIAIVNHVENIKILHADSILASFLQSVQW